MAAGDRPSRKRAAIRRPALPSFLHMRMAALLLLLPQAASGFAPARPTVSPPRPLARVDPLRMPCPKPSTLLSASYDEEEDWYDAMVRRKRLAGGRHTGGEDSHGAARAISGALMESRRSFGHVEGSTYRLMSQRPAVALAIFVAAGAIVAYLSGLFFLGGYISSANPYENGAIPYWEEDVCEICKQIQAAQEAAAVAASR